MTDEILTVHCGCGKPMKVRASSIGKKVRCPECKEITTIAAPADAGAPLDAPKPASAAAKPGSKNASLKKDAKQNSSKAVSQKAVAKKAAAENKSTKSQNVETMREVTEADRVAAAKPESPSDAVLPDFSAFESSQVDTGPSTTDQSESKTELDLQAELPSFQPEAIPAINLVATDRPASGSPQTPAAGSQPIGDRDGNVDGNVDGGVAGTVVASAPTIAAATTDARADGFAIEPQRSAESVVPAAGANALAPIDSSERKYPTLTLVAKIYKVLAIFWLLVMGVLSFLPLLALAQGASLLTILPAVFGSLCLAILGAVTMFAASEFLRLMLDIQDNTHRASLR